MNISTGSPGGCRTSRGRRRELARDLAARVAAHAVGDREEGAARRSRRRRRRAGRVARDRRPCPRSRGARPTSGGARPREVCGSTLGVSMRGRSCARRGRPGRSIPGARARRLRGARPLGRDAEILALSRRRTRRGPDTPRGTRGLRGFRASLRATAPGSFPARGRRRRRPSAGGRVPTEARVAFGSTSSISPSFRAARPSRSVLSTAAAARRASPSSRGSR